MAENLAPFAAVAGSVPFANAFAIGSQARAARDQADVAGRRLSLEEQLQPYRITTLQQQSDMAQFQLDRAKARSKIEDDFLELLETEMAKQKASMLDEVVADMEAYREFGGGFVGPPMPPQDFIGSPGPWPSPPAARTPLSMSGQGVGVGDIAGYASRLSSISPLDVSAPRVSVTQTHPTLEAIEKRNAARAALQGVIYPRGSSRAQRRLERTARSILDDVLGFSGIDLLLDAFDADANGNAEPSLDEILEKYPELQAFADVRVPAYGPNVSPGLRALAESIAREESGVYTASPASTIP